MRHSLLHTAGNVVWAARNERAGLLPLLAAYSRLKVSELLRSPPPDGPRRTRILGHDVAFFDHYWLVEMFEEIFLRRQYAFESSKERPFIVDVGSNIGLAILFFKRLFPGATVLGFEPDPEAFRLLERNVRENGLEGVRLLNEAVYDGTGSIELHLDPATPGSPQHSVRSGRAAAASRTVPATRLSDHVTGPVDFLKLDVEGAEGVVLDELERSGKLGLVDRLAVEYHHHLLADDDRLGELLSTLERNGFGYQLEARLPRAAGEDPGAFQNVLVHAYRKATSQ